MFAKKKKLIVVAVAALGVATYGLSKGQNIKNLPLSLSNDIESIASCESIGWWDNDGNCVKNDRGEYFCKSDSWHELTDCLQ